MSDIKKKSWAGAVFNEKFILIDTYSGYNLTVGDDKAPQHFLPLDADNNSLGNALLEALKNSRWLDPSKEEERAELFNPDTRQERYNTWVKNMMDRYNYKTKRALFKDMHACNIRVSENKMKISPLRHEKLEGWGAEKGDNLVPVILPADSSPEEVGVALRLAFTRCY